MEIRCLCQLGQRSTSRRLRTPFPLDFTSCITREYDGGGWYTQWTTVLEEWENWPTRIRNELDWSDVVTDPHMQTVDYGFVIGTVQSIVNSQENTKNISSVLKALILSQYTEKIVLEECSYHHAI